MKLIMSFLFLFLLVNCAPTHTNFLNIGPEFKPYVDMFECEAKRMGRPLKIKTLTVEFGDTKYRGEYVIGLCGQSNMLNPVITIDKEFWDESSETSREILMFHELGHCILDKNHNNNMIMLPTVAWPIPASIMGAELLSDNYYVLNRDYYLHELFSE